MSVLGTHHAPCRAAPRARARLPPAPSACPRACLPHALRARPRVPRPSAPPAHSRVVLARPSAYCTPRARPSLLPRLLYRDTGQTSSQYRLANCIAIHSSPGRQVLQYTLLTAHLRPLSCNTNPYLAVLLLFKPATFQPHCVTIQCPLSQYNLGSSPIKFSAQIFFFFHYKYFYLFISSSLKNH